MPATVLTPSRQTAQSVPFAELSEAHRPSNGSSKQHGKLGREPGQPGGGVPPSVPASGRGCGKLGAVLRASDCPRPVQPSSVTKSRCSVACRRNERPWSWSEYSANLGGHMPRAAHTDSRGRCGHTPDGQGRPRPVSAPRHGWAVWEGGSRRPRRAERCRHRQLRKTDTDHGARAHAATAAPREQGCKQAPCTAQGHARINTTHSDVRRGRSPACAVHRLSADRPNSPNEDVRKYSIRTFFSCKTKENCLLCSD